MQMGVHSFFLILILVAKPHIGDFVPIAGQGLAITVLYGVEAILFDASEEADGIVQRFFVSGGAMILTQTVNSKT